MLPAVKLSDVLEDHRTSIDQNNYGFKEEKRCVKVLVISQGGHMSVGRLLAVDSRTCTDSSPGAENSPQHPPGSMAESPVAAQCISGEIVSAFASTCFY